MCRGVSDPNTTVWARGVSLVRTLARPCRSLKLTTRLVICPISAALSMMASLKGFASDPNTYRT
jgi:hypothetical protein